MSDPRICVLIPAFNEERVIEGTIDSLLAAGFNRPDIFVVDDMSTDATAILARRTGVNVYTVTEKGGCKANAQNYGLAHFKLHTRYTHVVFIDADSQVEPQFLNAMFEAADSNPDATLLSGRVKSAKSSRLISAMRAYEYTFLYEITRGGQANFNVIPVSSGCASMYKLADLLKMTIDPGTLAEDMDLTLQVHRRKGAIKYVSGAGVITQDPATVREYNTQIMRWYRGFWQMVLKHKTFAFTRKRPIDLYMAFLAVESLFLNRFFLLLVFCCFFSLKSIVWGLAADAVLFLAVGAIAALKTRRWDVLCKLPIFYWLSYLNLFAFWRSFVEIIVRRKKILAWNKVERYAFDQS